MKGTLRRREFVRSLGHAAATAALAPLVTGCRTAQSVKAGRPNILWIAVEDLSPFLSCYGHADIPTPNLDRLAAGGVRFNRVFMPTPVCSPCRTSLITGMMSTTIGTHNHHSSRSEETALRLPETAKTVPELFREAGYFTFNSGKDDYNFWYDRERLYSGKYTTHPLYGKSGAGIDWNARPAGQPFFGQLQLAGGKHVYAKDFESRVRHPIDREAVEMPPYYPDHPEIREEWARHYDCARITDDEVGEIVARLGADGLLDDTVAFFFSDHGMGLWRHKQFCYDGGLHVPFIVSWPGNPSAIGAGKVRNDLVSGLDIAATSLALAGIPVPGSMESRDLFAERFRPREYVVSTRDRCDYTIDRIRTIRTDRFRYIRNFFPDRPYMQPNYRDAWDSTRLMRRLHEEGRLDPVQDVFWSEARPAEELYDLAGDPHEVRNLSGDPAHAEILERHRAILDEWIRRSGDKGRFPEDRANLKFIFDWWGDACANPEFDVFRR